MPNNFVLSQHMHKSPIPSVLLDAATNVVSGRRSGQRCLDVASFSVDLSVLLLVFFKKVWVRHSRVVLDLNPLMSYFSDVPASVLGVESIHLLEATTGLVGKWSVGLARTHRLGEGKVNNRDTGQSDDRPYKVKPPVSIVNSGQWIARRGEKGRAYHPIFSIPTLGGQVSALLLHSDLVEESLRCGHHCEEASSPVQDTLEGRAFVSES